MRLGRYEVLGTLATGGMAEVLLARLEGTAGFERRVVIKRVLADRANDDDFRRLFEQEARFASVISHPNVIQVLDSGVDDSGASYLVMELVDGASLRDVLDVCRERNQLAEVKLLCRVFAQVAEALVAVHDTVDPATQTPLQLVHRDVSPDNVLLSRQGAVKLSDFGISRAMTERSRTRPDQIRGKLHYLAPEQLLGLPIASSLDVWSFGVTLFEALTLQRAWAGDNEGRVMHSIVNDPAPSLEVLRPGLPPALIAIVERCLDKDPTRRPDRLHAVAIELDALAQGVTIADVGRWVAAAVPEKPQLKPFNFSTTSSNQSPRKEALAQRFTEFESMAPATEEELELDRSGFAPREEQAAPPPPKKSLRWLWLSIAATAVIVGVGVVVSRLDVRTPQTQVLITSQPPGATISVGGRELGVTPWAGSMTLVSPVTIELDAEGYEHETAQLSPGARTLSVPLHRARRQ